MSRLREKTTQRLPKLSKKLSITRDQGSRHSSSGATKIQHPRRMHVEHRHHRHRDRNIEPDVVTYSQDHWLHRIQRISALNFCLSKAVRVVQPCADQST